MSKTLHIPILPTQGRGYNPRQRRWGTCSLANCKRIFGFYYNSPIGFTIKDCFVINFVIYFISAVYMLLTSKTLLKRNSYERHS